MFKIDFTKRARTDLIKLHRNEPAAYEKALNLIEELKTHPRTGTGRPKMLTGDKYGQWSRRITDRHRLVYTIEDNILRIIVLTSSGHYNDK